MKSARAMVWGLVCYVGLSMSPAQADVPSLIRYQGQLADSGGAPLEGPYDLIFRLYDAATGGAALWTELHPDVVMTRGQFSVLLGSVTSLATEDWSQPRWLSIQVNADPELSPRQQITSVPLAVRAHTAEQLSQAITPSLITPQGAGSGLDADAVDGKHASDLLARANHTGTQPSSTITGTFAPTVINPQGSGSNLDADKLDGKDSTSFATSSHGHGCSLGQLPRGQTGHYACAQSGTWCVATFLPGDTTVKSCDEAFQFLNPPNVICCR